NLGSRSQSNVESRANVVLEFWVLDTYLLDFLYKKIMCNYCPQQITISTQMRGTETTIDVAWISMLDLPPNFFAKEAIFQLLLLLGSL
ncbi:hypothetical protein H5410_022495, partial [Solanum commersonii]